MYSITFPSILSSKPVLHIDNGNGIIHRMKDNSRAAGGGIHIFTSESVSEGHPDKVADQISDAILDACLATDEEAHVACETMCGHNVVVNMGEITCRNFRAIDTEGIARDVARRIGYDRKAEGFSWDTFKYLSFLHGQSADIAQGVNRASRRRQGAGDQGMMFGYATDETPDFMPAPIVYSHALLRHFAALRKDGGCAWLRPDSKSQLSVVYENGRPSFIDTVVVSHQTTARGASNTSEIRAIARKFLEEKTGLVTKRTKFLVNPTGKFVIGGPSGDSGLTGRKIIVDTYGGMASHGGGAFSGKDPSKVDRSAAYYSRYAAKNIVAAGVASRCQVQVAYAIGVDKPVSFCVKTFGTNRRGISNADIEAMLVSGKTFDFRPYSLTEDLGLKRPQGWRYLDTAAYGHFGRGEFPWERLDKVDAVKRHFGLR